MKPRARLAVPLTLVIILCAAAALRAFRLAAPFGGYLAYNEGWYSLVAGNYATNSLLSPLVWTGLPDYNVPPFFSWLLHAVSLLFGAHEAVLRMVPLVADMVTCLAVFFLGRRSFGPAAGLAAAALYATAPMSVAVGRNVQPDALWVCFSLLALLAWLRSERGARPAWSLAAGILFGFAVFTKQTAVMLLPAFAAWEILRPRGERRLHPGHILTAVAAIAVPAPYYLYHLVTHPGAFLGAQASLSIWTSGSNAFLASYTFGEILWGFSPALVATAFAGIFVALWRREDADRLALLSLAAVLAFFILWHFHSYYLLPALPFAALLAARWMVRLPAPVSVPLIMIVAAAGALFSLAFLGAAKYGAFEFSTAAGIAAEAPNPRMVVRNDTWDSFGPALAFYFPRNRIIPERDFAPRVSASVPADGTLYLLGYTESFPKSFPGGRIQIWRTVYCPVLFGRRFSVRLANENFFRLNGVRFDRVGPVTRFGLERGGFYPSLILGAFLPGQPIPARGDALFPDG